MNNNYFSVYEVNSYIKDIFEEDIILNDIKISGEISNYTHHSSGHMYFTLKDDKAKINCVMFKTDTLSLKFRPQNGNKVLVRGRISVYERDGKYQVYCKSMQPDGVGRLYEEYELLKQKLELEGLFDVARKKSLPFFPKKIGVVTSPTGAVIKDIINVSTNRFKGVNIVLYPCKVQGEGSEESIIKGINYFNSRDDIDVVIIGRGGGSIEELWSFNGESLARCIYASKIPIVSAVGHETDFTIADFVSDYRASTPSHAAEIVVPSLKELSYKVNSLGDKILSLQKRGIKFRKDNILSYEKILSLKSPNRKLLDSMQYVDVLYDKILKGFSYKIKNNRKTIDDFQRNLSLGLEKHFSIKKHRYSMAVSKLEALSPIGVLKRGYTFTESNNKVVNSIKNIKEGDTLNVNMIDGEIVCKVESIMEGDKWQLEKKK